jgi:hypothetical protein
MPHSAQKRIDVGVQDACLQHSIHAPSLAINSHLSVYGLTRTKAQITGLQLRCLMSVDGKGLAEYSEAHSFAPSASGV